MERVLLRGRSWHGRADPLSSANGVLAAEAGQHGDLTTAQPGYQAQAVEGDSRLFRRDLRPKRARNFRTSFRFSIRETVVPPSMPLGAPDSTPHGNTPCDGHLSRAIPAYPRRLPPSLSLTVGPQPEECRGHSNQSHHIAGGNVISWIIFQLEPLPFCSRTLKEARNFGSAHRRL